MNKFYKMIVVMMMIMATVLTTGCESQAEKQAKFDKLEQHYINRELQMVNEINAADKVNQIQKEFDIWENGIKELEQVTNEMEKIAKGNKEMEAKVAEKRKKLEVDKKDLPKLKALAKQKGWIK